jgi:hypothetical protein
LARRVSAFDAGVVLDQIVGHGEHVTALDLDLGSVRFKPLERAGTGERSARAPADRAAVARGRQVEDLHAEVRERIEQRSEVFAHAVGRDQVLLPDEPVHTVRGPASGRGVEVVGRERLEVALGDVGGGSHRGGAVYAPSISCAS